MSYVRNILFVCSALLLAAQCLAGIAETRHNLSVTGPGPIKSTTEGEICVFCHTPHDAKQGAPFLWNRRDSTVNYNTYNSSTLFAAIGQPTGASKLCLSCHDGTIALGEVVSRPVEIPFAGGIRFLPTGPTNLGEDLADDHPVSLLYDDALVTGQGELLPPATLINDVRLDPDGMLQCTSCHDPHDDTFGQFLVQPNNFSAICLECHSPLDWMTSAHALSTAVWNTLGADPWPHTSFTTVAENGCESCHRPHGAGGHERLLNYLLEEDNCLTCHDGNVASTDIEAELIKLVRHPVQDTVGVHDPTEDFTGTVATHVECVDCHNPHRANDTIASAPDVPGVLLGVSGITVTNQQVDDAMFAYEICFKCHADSNVIAFSEIPRQLPQINTRLEFDITGPSFHPVEAAGKNPDVPSLLSPYTESSIIYCTDCHNNDDGPAAGGLGPAGPHGSANKFLLEENYTTTDFPTESPFEYAMCYKCHDRNSILNDDSFSEHDTHIRGEDTPCSACHDPHGISSTQGNPTNNSHLINFDLSIVSPNNDGDLFFEDGPDPFSGSCSLLCHGKKHRRKAYP